MADNSNFATTRRKSPGAYFNGVISKAAGCAALQTLREPWTNKRTARSVWSAVFSTALFLAFLALLRFDVLPFTGRAPLPTPRNAGGASAETDAKVTTQRDGNVVHVFVENSELSEVTVTFAFSTQNLKGSVSFPHTATFGPGKSEAFTLEPADCRAAWSFSYTNNLKLGSKEAVHNDSAVYQLPYGANEAFEVSQGYNSKFSHFGPNQYAIDWKMPEETPVRAARSGTVVKVKDDSATGGGSMKYDAFNNFVIIRHDDGTLGQYCHLHQHGVRVQPGQLVQAGDVIALSGNTGFSSGPHLHFCVFKTQDGIHRVSIPVRFQDKDGRAVTLVEGRQYPVRATSTTASGARQLAAR